MTLGSLRQLVDAIPDTLLTQIYIEPQPSNPLHIKLLQRIRQLCDHNRDKVQQTYASRNIIPAEWTHISTRGATTPGTLSVNANTDDTPSPLRHPPRTSLDHQPPHQVSPIPDSINYDLRWHRHAQKLANAQNKSSASHPPKSGKKHKTVSRKTSSITHTSVPALHHWLATNPTRKRGHSPERDTKGQPDQDYQPSRTM